MMIIIVFGLPGSGKSYFASRLAKMINAGYVSSDKVRKELFKESVYSEQEKRAVYDKMLQQMEQAIQQKNNLVLDATFHRKDTRKMFVEEMKGKGNIFFIEVQADENIIRERFKKPRPYSEADFEVYKHIRRQNEPLNEPHLILKSTDDNIDEMLRKTSEYLKIKNDNKANQ
jgi:predicted kinase